MVTKEQLVIKNINETWHEGLTEKQRRFCETYSSNGGNALQAANAAGYRHSKTAGPRMLENVGICSALEKLREDTTSSAIADRQERQSLWTTIMRDENMDIKNRLRASEMLGRSQADFIERRLLEGHGMLKIEMVTRIVEGGAR